MYHRFGRPHGNGQQLPTDERVATKKARLSRRWSLGTAVVLVVIELIAVGLILTAHFLRASLSLVPLALFGLSWLHALLPFCAVATLTVPDNTHTLYGTSILYVFALLLDTTALTLAAVYPKAFGAGLFWHYVLSAQAVFVAVDIAQFVRLSVETAEAQKRLDSDEPRWQADDDEEERKNKQSNWGGWRTRVFLWLVFSILSLVRLLFPGADRGWYLLATIPYLWPTPFIIALSTLDFAPTKIVRDFAIAMLVFSILGGTASYIARVVLDGFDNVLDFILLVVVVAQAVFDVYMIYVVNKVAVVPSFYPGKYADGKKKP
jgi:hypothetical protein